MSAAVAEAVFPHQYPAPARPAKGRANRGGMSKASVPAAVKLIGTRPHLTSEERPPTKCCKKCRHAPLYNPDAALKPPGWFADGLSMSVTWNA